MRVIAYTDRAVYRERLRAALGERELENNLILGVTGQLVNEPGRYPEAPRLYLVEDDAGFRMAVLQTPPLRLLVSTAEGDPAPACEALAGHLAAKGIALPGCNGPGASARACAEAWTRAQGGAARVHTRLRAYSLRQVTAPEGVPGHMRPAGPQDAELLAGWWHAFNLEALGQDAPEEARLRSGQRLAAGDLYVWDDGSPAAMAGKGRPLERGISIGPVYTPPERRRRGYASALVAALSRALLDAGWEYCSLFTDLANPTSNHIYQAVGYRPAGDYLEYDFVR